jgi:predicted nucleic acid-binding protein
MGLVRKKCAKADKTVSLIEEIVEIITVNEEVAKEAIDLKIGKKLELLDSIHAVTALLNNAVLSTRDEDLRRKVEESIFVKNPEEILKEC